ncbi:hypothetical protein ACRYI5_01140 [Furfurilactobacillus sp. WILCCON 0119]
MNVTQWSIEDWAALIAVLTGVGGFVIWLVTIIQRMMRQLVREMITELTTQFNNLSLSSVNEHRDLHDKNDEQDRRLNSHSTRIDDHEQRLSKVEGAVFYKEEK